MLTELLLGILLLGLLYTFVNKKPRNLPPGKWGWPVVGSLPSEEVSLGDQVLELRKKHGDIVSWRMGSRIFIFICDYKLIKAAFSKMEFTDRPDFYSFDIFNAYNKCGLANSNGQMWVTNRRFVLRQLRDLGMGKTRLEDAIQYEASCLVKDFEKHAGRPGPLPWSINVAVLNVIWKMVADQRYDVSDPSIQKFNQLINDMLEDFQGPVVWFDMMPWLIPIVPNFVRRWMGIEKLSESVDTFLAYMAEQVNDHKKTLDRDNPRDYIDAYLIEMENQKGNPESTMTEFDLWNCAGDLFSAGSETTASTIRWSICFMAKYPRVLAKVQKEIDSVVARDSYPSIMQRERMPYLEAVILEIMRHVSLVRLGLAHFATEDVQFGGYTIPKGAVLLGHTECCHMDPKYWEKPTEFYPEHFLDSEGKLMSKKEGLMPFSLGRRQCPGESLARMELFVFLSALFQNFNFSVPVGGKVSLEKDPKQAFLNLPKPQDILITKRL